MPVTSMRAARPLGLYRLEQRLGIGDVTEAFRARADGGRVVCLKRFHVDVDTPRFRAEAKAAAGLEHDNVVRVVDFGEVAKTHFVVSELVDGVTARDVTKCMQRIPVADVVAIGVGVARSLAYIHEQQLVHGDVSPSNVFITAAGWVKLADFGLTRAAHETLMNREGQVSSKAPYRAPEQVTTPRNIDHRADQFALGVLLWELLAGRPLFARTNAMEAARAVVRDEPEQLWTVRADVDKRVSALVARLLRKDREKRFVSMNAALAALSAELRNPALIELAASTRVALEVAEEETRAGDLRTYRIKPSTTDRDITVFDAAHHAYVRRDIVTGEHAWQKPRGELLVYLAGTQPTEKSQTMASAPRRLLHMAADVGYHVVNLAYPNHRSVATIVGRDRTDEDAYERVRRCVIAGGSDWMIDVARAESIENRLEKLLAYLSKHNRDEGWSQFLAGGVRWESVALVGTSQGGGHALLMAIDRKVARVVCFSSPRDYDHGRDRPVPFMSRASATPKSRFFVFHHPQDRTGRTSPAQFQRTLDALGLGASVDVEDSSEPYDHARVLTIKTPHVDYETDREGKQAHFAPVKHADEENAKLVVGSPGTELEFAL